MISILSKLGELLKSDEGNSQNNLQQISCLMINHWKNFKMRNKVGVPALAESESIELSEHEAQGMPLFGHECLYRKSRRSVVNY